MESDQSARDLVIRPPRRSLRRYERGMGFTLELLLTGPLREDTTDLIDGLLEVGRRGLGPNRVPFVVLRAVLTSLDGPETEVVYQGEGLLTDHLEELAFIPAPLPVRDALEVQLHSPIDLRQRGLPARTLEFESLVRASSRRLTDSYRRHGLGLVPWRFDDILKAARSVVADTSRVRHDRQEVWSSRQERAFPIMGYVGTMRLGGLALQDLVGLLQVGSFLQVGHGTFAGCGSFDVRVPAL